MGWRELMQPRKENQGPSDMVTKVTKPMESAPEHPKTGGFVNIVTQSECSQKCSTGEAWPFQPGERVTYQVPDPTSRSVHPPWVEHTGQVLDVDPVGEMVLIEPATEAGTGGRWVWWGYVRKVSDGQA